MRLARGAVMLWRVRSLVRSVQRRIRPTLAESLAPYFRPSARASGTELMAPLLAALVRSQRPRLVVEVGGGYSTPWIAQALRETARDALQEWARLSQTLRAAAARGLTFPQPPVSSWPPAVREQFLRLLAIPTRMALCDPSFHLTPYDPQLHVFEYAKEGDAWVHQIRRALQRVGVADRVTLHTGRGFVAEELPAGPIDLAWNDGNDYAAFVDVIAPRLSLNGLIVLHWPWNGAQEAELERIAERWPDLSPLALVEPHKLAQAGCLCLQRHAPRLSLAREAATVAAVNTLIARLTPSRAPVAEPVNA